MARPIRSIIHSSRLHIPPGRCAPTVGTAPIHGSLPLFPLPGAANPSFGQPLVGWTMFTGTAICFVPVSGWRPMSRHRSDETHNPRGSGPDWTHSHFPPLTAELSHVEFNLSGDGGSSGDEGDLHPGSVNAPDEN